jgi:Holliday junction resolvasome RuvABC endonuclease subunit
MASAIKVFSSGEPLNSPVYIGIDQSYSGFAITALNDSGYHTTVFKSELRGVDRLMHIEAHLVDTIEKYKLSPFAINDVAMEGYAFGSQMANMLGELGGMVKLALRSFGIYPLIVPPTSLKKYVTGKGQGVSKSQILLHVYKKWGVELNDDNAADSYALAHLVSGRHSLAYEKEIYAKLQDPKFREK